MGETMVMMILIAIPVVSVILCLWKAFVWLWWKPAKLEKCLREQGIRGPPFKLIHGNMKENASYTKEAKSKPMGFSHSIVPRVFPFLHQVIQKYGKLSIIWVGGTPRVNIMDPELVREIMSNKSGHFNKVRVHPMAKMIANGIIAFDGEQWGKHRRIINPAFHIEKLKMMLPAFYTSCAELISRWEKLASEGSCEVDLAPEFQTLTKDVISRTAFGSNYEEGRRIFQLQAEQVGYLLKALQSAYIPGSRFLPTKTYRRLKEITRELRTIILGMIENREKAIKQGEIQDDEDLLSLLMRSNLQEIEQARNLKNEGISVDEIIEECKLFYFAGQETTSSLLLWTMVLLSVHQEWQEQAREEVLQVFGRSKPDFDGLSHLKVVNMILYEVLRLYPPFSLLNRITDEEIKVGEITLPSGTMIGVPVLLIHHDRDIWGEDADEFKPERFKEGISKVTKNQVSFIPFGWGPRICVGQNFALIEAKMALILILQRFSFELSPAYVHAPETVVTLQPQHGAQVVIHKL